MGGLGRLAKQLLLAGSFSHVFPSEFGIPKDQLILVSFFHVFPLEQPAYIPIGSMYGIYGNMDPINIPPLC